jgi:hypothetical protein
VRAGIEACQAAHPAHRPDRLFGFVGVDRNRRAADTTAWNMMSYMLEITANKALPPIAVAPDRRGSLKNKARARVCNGSFFAIALNIGFFLCYFRRRVE